MDKLKKLQHHKKSDKRIALLSLAVAQNVTENSECLTDEEMAVLLDGVCTVNEREIFQRHLAGCDSCYKHWVELARGGGGVVVANTKKKGNLIRYSHFALAGSLLAAAASVVLFLNITQQVPSPSLDLSRKPMVKEDNFTSLKRPVEPISAQHKTRPVEQERKVTQDFIKNGTISSQSIQGVRLSEEKIFEMADEVIPMRKANRTHKRVHRDRKMEMAIKHPAPAKSLAISQSQAHSWLVDVQKGCINNETHVFFWKQKYFEGQRITNYRSKEEEQFVKDLLPLLLELQQSRIERLALCKSIVLRINSVTP
jgi:hypothetical protein